MKTPVRRGWKPFRSPLWQKVQLRPQPSRRSKSGAKNSEKVQDIRNASVRLGIKECRYTISVGYAAIAGNVSAEALPAPALETLFERADRALYAAKRGGRDRAVANSAVPGEDADHPQSGSEARRDGRSLATADVVRA